MILYPDTGALVKLYVIEHGRDAVTAALEASEKLATSTIAYAEACSALARKWRDSDLTDEAHLEAANRLGDDWSTFSRLDVTDPLVLRAGQLAQTFALRSFDAVHLASAFTFSDRMEDVQFLAFDIQLNQAARSASLQIYGDGSLVSPSSER